MTKQRILVTGATGKVGRHLVRQLAGTGIAVRALSRNPGTAVFPGGVDAVEGDLLRPASLAAALADVDAAFLLWPAADSSAAAQAVAAIAATVPRIVYLSAMSLTDPPSGFWFDVEREIERHEVEWTFLRAGGFAGNTLMWADQIRADGVVRWPYADAARSLIHERDIAAVAALTLTQPGHHGKKYVLTGPEVITQAEQVRTIGSAIGRPTRFAELDPEQARAQLIATGWNAEFADHALATWAGQVTNPEPVTDTVRDLTGALAHTFAQWATDHAADFR